MNQRHLLLMLTLAVVTALANAQVYRARDFSMGGFAVESAAANPAISLTAIKTLTKTFSNYQILTEVCTGDEAPEVRDEFLEVAGRIYVDSGRELGPFYDERLATYRNLYKNTKRCPQGRYRKMAGLYEQRLAELNEAADALPAPVAYAAATVAPPPAPVPQGAASPIQVIAHAGLQKVSAEELQCLIPRGLQAPVEWVENDGVVTVCTGQRDPMIRDNAVIMMAVFSPSLPDSLDTAIAVYDENYEPWVEHWTKWFAHPMQRDWCPKYVSKRYQQMMEYQDRLLQYAEQDRQIAAGGNYLVVIGGVSFAPVSHPEQGRIRKILPADLVGAEPYPLRSADYLATDDATVAACSGSRDPVIRNNAVIMLGHHARGDLMSFRNAVAAYDRRFEASFLSQSSNGCFKHTNAETAYAKIEEYQKQLLDYVEKKRQDPN